MQHSLNSEFHNLINKIETKGFLSQPRGLKVKELEMERLTINPTMSLADFEARPFNWKYFMGELAWYLKQDRHVDYINNFSSFWKNIADEDGNINSNYGHLLFGKQLQWALDSLKKDINTRQAISFVSKPEFQYEGNKDFVCTMYLNFWIRENELHMKVDI
jgi:thymidylate synthase